MAIRQIFLDTETTGFDADKGDRIVEIGCVEIIGRTRSESPELRFHEYTNPDRDVGDSYDVHHLSNDFLSDKPRFDAIADRFIEFIRGAELVIHNAAFDVAFLNMELGRLGKGRLQDYCPKITDSLALAKKKRPGRRNSLDVLCDEYGIDRTKRANAHGALLDSELLAEVYLAMTREQSGLFGTEAISVRTTQVLDEGPIEIPIAVCPQSDQLAHEEFMAKNEKKNCKREGGFLWRELASPSAES